MKAFEESLLLLTQHLPLEHNKSRVFNLYQAGMAWCIEFIHAQDLGYVVIYPMARFIIYKVLHYKHKVR